MWPNMDEGQSARRSCGGDMDNLLRQLEIPKIKCKKVDLKRWFDGVHQIFFWLGEPRARRPSRWSRDQSHRGEAAVAAAAKLEGSDDTKEAPAAVAAASASPGGGASAQRQGDAPAASADRAVGSQEEVAQPEASPVAPPMAEDDEVDFDE